MKVKLVLVAIALIYNGLSEFNSLAAQEIQAGFAVSIGGASNQHGNGISADGNGNTYVTGHFYGEIVLGESTYTTAGNQDAFLAKLDAQGEVLWALAFGGSGADEGRGVVSDAAGNCYITGFIGSTDVQIGEETISSLSGYDVYVLKFSPTGNLLWARTFGGFSNQNAAAIAMDSEGDIHIAGSFQGTMVMDSYTLTATTSIDAFTCKMDAQGNVLWAKAIGGPSQVEARAITTDLAGNTYVSGDFLGDSVSADTFTENGFGSYDIFLVKYSPTGAVLDLQVFGAEGADSGLALATDFLGNVYMSGYFEGSFDAGSVSLSSNGNRDMMVVKIDEDGTVLWAQSAGGTGNDIAYALDTDAEGNCYFTGLFAGTVMLGGYELSGGGTMMAKLSPQGDYAWAIGFADGNVDNGGRGITVNDEGAVRVIGNFFTAFEIGGIEVESSVGRDVYVVLIEDVLYLGTESWQADGALRIFPNPASSVVNISGIAPYTRCALIDVHGKVVHLTHSTADRITLDISALPVGIYLLRTDLQGDFNVAKIQIAR